MMSVRMGDEGGGPCAGSSVLQVTRHYHILQKRAWPIPLYGQLPFFTHHFITPHSLSFLSSVLLQPSSNLHFFIFSLEKTFLWHVGRLMGSVSPHLFVREEAKPCTVAL